MEAMQGTPIEPDLAPVGARLLVRRIRVLQAPQPTKQTLPGVLPERPRIVSAETASTTLLTEVVVVAWSKSGENVALRRTGVSENSGSVETGWHSARLILVVELLPKESI